MSAQDTKLLIAATALNRMFAGSHFSICTIDAVATMLGVVVDKAAHNQLRPLHCVDWSEMPPELRAIVPQLIQQALGGDEAFRFEIQPAPPKSQHLEPVQNSQPTRRPLLARVFGD